ncbi:MAG TPA: CsbD family protein [Acidimicrobiia bacterium]|nr:CsbD family protein [Acidimicrobiia bacterium]
MGSNSGMDEAKGRMKEAAGALTDDEDLKREGKVDRAGATVKDKAETASDKVGDAVDNLKDKFNRDR